jgi:copper chaperone
MEAKMKTLKVPDMHCEKCVERISGALSAKGIDFTVSLTNKTVDVDSEKVSGAIEALDDLGFCVKEQK